MQLNFSIEEELHQRLIALSRDRGTNLPELTRSALRALSPEEEEVTVSVLQPEGGIMTLGEQVKVHGRISEIHLAKFNLWGGSVVLTAEERQKIGLAGFGQGHLHIIAENGRQGSAVVVGAQGTNYNLGRTGGCDLLLHFAGTSTLS